MKTLIVIFLLCLPLQVMAAVSLNENTIEYTGEITDAQNARFKELLSSNIDRIASITVTSGGGNINAGMDLAELIFNNQLDIIIPTFCFSSCANYLIPAANQKVFGTNAVIGWHGDAASARWRDADIDAMVSSLTGKEKQTKWLALRAHYDRIIEQAKERETALYEKWQVNPDIMRLGLKGNVKDAVLANKARGWTYSLDAMAFFGLSNLPSSDRWEPKSTSSFPLIIVSHIQ